MVKRVCRCGKIFCSDSGSVRCDDCLKWQNYLCKHPQNIKVNVKDDIHFYFDSWTINKSEELLGFRVFGNCQYDKKDATHVSINIYLHKIEQSLEIKTDDERIKQVILVINHETLHKTIYLTTDFNTSKSADKSLMPRLEREGYI